VGYRSIISPKHFRDKTQADVASMTKIKSFITLTPKIIKRARQNYLYENYISQNHPLDKVLLDCNEVLVHFKVKVKAGNPY
jgi:hypothetical protein